MLSLVRGIKPRDQIETMLAAQMAAEFPKGLGAVTATYVAKYDADAIAAAFSQTSNAPLKDIVRQASRYLVSAHRINSSDPSSEVDTKVVESVRNFLFGPPGAGQVLQ